MKDNITDYATEAFAYYARNGKPNIETLKENIRKQALEESKKETCGISGNISKPTEYQIMRMEEAVEQHMAEIQDIAAVCKTIKAIEQMKKGEDIKKAVEMVYMAPGQEQRKEKGYISARVAAAAISIPASERSIYYWLKIARVIFAKERGLRISTTTKRIKRDKITGGKITAGVFTAHIAHKEEPKIQTDIRTIQNIEVAELYPNNITAHILNANNI